MHFTYLANGHKAAELCELLKKKFNHFYHHNPLMRFYKRNPTSSFYIIDHRSSHLVCMCKSTNCPGICTITYYMWLVWLSWQPCATMCHYVLSLVNKLQNSDEKWHNLSHFYNIDHIDTNLVCMRRTSQLLFKTAI